MKQKSLWRFTLVNRFSLEHIDEVVCFGDTLVDATKHLRRLFDASLYDIDDVVQVRNSNFVMVGLSNYTKIYGY